MKDILYSVYDSIDVNIALRLDYNLPKLFHLTNKNQTLNIDLDTHIHIYFNVVGGPSEYAVHHSDREQKDMGVLKKKN